MDFCFISSRACYHFREGDPGAEGDPRGGSGLTDPGTVLQGLAMASDRDRSWWQSPSTAPDKARDEAGPGSFQGAQSGVKGDRARETKPPACSKSSRGMRPQPGFEAHCNTHLQCGCSQRAAERVGPRSMREKSLEANMPAEQLRHGLKAWS